jgi:hypothetical protein
MRLKVGQLNVSNSLLLYRNFAKVQTQDRMTILQQLEDGKIDAQEALRLFESEPQPNAAADAVTKRSIPDPVIQKWKRWWLLPLGIGVGVTVFGAALMYSALNAWGLGFGVFFASLIFFGGVIIMALGGWARTARWVHVRVDTGKDEFPRHIAISFPSVSPDAPLYVEANEGKEHVQVFIG